MAELTRWTPRELMSPFSEIEAEMNRVFSNFLNPNFMRLGAVEACNWYPAVDIEDEADKYVLMAELPGMRQEDIKITLHNGTLTLSGERRVDHEEKTTCTHCYERCYGKFERSFNLPSKVKSEDIKANYRDGILEIDIPKSEEVKPREVEIKVG
jgi:HSP20 family protein